MITHAVRVSDFLATIRARLKPGGHLYLHNEPDDAEFLKGSQSMLATLNPLHLQAFDQASLVRALTANGFETRFVKHQKNETLFLLARAADTAARHDVRRRNARPAWPRIGRPTTAPCCGWTTPPGRDWPASGPTSCGTPWPAARRSSTSGASCGSWRHERRPGLAAS